LGGANVDDSNFLLDFVRLDDDDDSAPTAAFDDADFFDFLLEITFESKNLVEEE
jgi:hypothetical protein